MNRHKGTHIGSQTPYKNKHAQNQTPIQRCMYVVKHPYKHMYADTHTNPYVHSQTHMYAETHTHTYQRIQIKKREWECDDTHRLEFCEICLIS